MKNASLLRRSLPTLVGLAVVIGLGIGLNAVMAARANGSAGDLEGDADRTKQRVLAVETVPLVWQETLTIPRKFTGEVTARRTADLAFEGSGRVTRLLVDEGDEVGEGSLLGELDRRDLDAKREEVVARRSRLSAQLEELRKGPRSETIEAARSSVEAIEEQVKLATLQRDRRAELAAKGTISVEQLDTTEAAVKELSARLAAGRAELSELENGTRAEVLRAQESALAEADAALRSVDIGLDKTRLRAPFPGRIERRFIDEGTVVSQQMPSPAFRIVETGWLEARVGLPVELATQLGNAPELTPESARLSLRGMPLSSKRLTPLPTVAPGTRTVEVIIELDLASAESAGARPGDTIALTVEAERAERGAWVPLGALTESVRGLWSAFAVAEDPEAPGTFRAARVELEVLTANESEAFVRGTFESGLQVVAKGVGRLVPGQRIRPLTASQSEAPGDESLRED